MKLCRAAAFVAFAFFASPPLAAAAPPRPTTPVRRPVSRRPPPKQVRPAVKPRSEPAGLQARTGIAIATRAIKSTEVAERVRGFERLGEVGTPAATELLAKALEPGGAAKGFEDRLTVVRALAKHAREPGPRQALARAMASASSGRADDAGEIMVRDTAALALARSAHREALEILGKALRQEGPIAASAGRAIVAHPPRSLEPIVSARGAPTRALVDAIDALGDQRAFSALRSWVKHGSPEIRGRAAITLTRLGDYETVALARQWRAKNKSDTQLLVAATRSWSRLGRPKPVAPSSHCWQTPRRSKRRWSWCPLRARRSCCQRWKNAWLGQMRAAPRCCSAPSVAWERRPPPAACPKS